MMIDIKNGELFMNQNFYEGIKNILTTARNKVYQTANFAMVEAYWNIGKSIIEEQGDSVNSFSQNQNLAV